MIRHTRAKEADNHTASEFGGAIKQELLLQLVHCSCGEKVDGQLRHAQRDLSRGIRIEAELDLCLCKSRGVFSLVRASASDREID